MRFLWNKWFLAFSMALMLSGCSKEVSSDSAEKKPQNLAEAQKIRVKFTENGVLQAYLYAVRLEENEKHTWGWQIRTEFFTEKDTIPDGNMVADSGFVVEGGSMNKRQVQVFGNVHLISPDSTELYSDSLRWNPSSQMIESNSKVKVIKKGEIIEGVGFKSDRNFSRIQVINVKGRLNQI